MDLSSLTAFSLKELFDLSFRSQEHQNLVREFSEASEKLELHVFSDIHLVRKYDAIDLSNDDANFMKWTFESCRVLNTFDKSKKLTTREINGLTIDCDESDLTDICCYTNHPHAVRMALISYLKNVFNCEIRYLNVKLEEVEDIGAYFNEPIFKTCQSLHVQDGSLSAEEMIRFLDEFPNAKDKLFSCNSGRDFVYPNSLSADTLVIDNAYWVTCDNLMNADCRNITLYGSPFTNKDLHLYLKKVLKSESVRLEVLSISSENTLDVDVITRDLSAVPHDPDVQIPKWSYYYDINSIPACVDVRRDLDGMMITIGRIMAENQNKTVFIAWRAESPMDKIDNTDEQ